MSDLTIIIPCYNEEKSIAKTLIELSENIKKNNLNWKILIVDDGSNDNSFEEIIKIKLDLIQIKQHPYNKGYGASLKTGILNSTSEFVAFYDADGQHSPEDLFSLYTLINNHDMIIGERGKDSHSDWTRRPGKWVLSKVANFLVGKKIPDLNSGLRVIKREVILKYLHLFPDGFSFSTTSTIAFLNLGYNVGYHPIIVKKRAGKSSVKQIKHGTNTILLILRLIVLFNPLKVFFPVSFILFFLGLVYGIIYGIILIYPNVRLIPAAFFLILTSVLIFFFGLVVDQISELRKHMNEKTGE